MTKKLPENFTGNGEVDGFIFRQIKRGQNALIYEVRSSEIRHFEVFSIKTTALCLDFEKRLYSDTDFKEIYPKSKDFGKWAWTCKDSRRAIDIFYNIEGPELNT